MAAAVLNCEEPGKVETAEVLKNAESAIALMSTVCEAIKKHRWDEAEELLQRMQSMVHQLRVDVRDERLRVGIPERQDDSRRDGSR